MLIGAALVASRFPKQDDEVQLLDEYHEVDAESAGGGLGDSAQPQ